MGRVPTTTKVQQMIDAAGIGEGANIKSGISFGLPSTEKQVDFVTPFLSTPRVVISPFWSYNEIWITFITADYFKWKNNSPSEDVGIRWIATTAGNS